MVLTKEQHETLSAICVKHFNMKVNNCGCDTCPLYSVCIVDTNQFAGNTLEEKTAEFERQMWALAEHVDMSAYGK